MENVTNSTKTTSSCSLSHEIALRDIFFVIFICFVLIVSVIGNSLTILAVCTSKEMRKHTTLRLVTALACSDMGYALTVLPFIISRTLHNEFFCHGLFFCYGFLIADTIFCFSSILWIFAIALHKFITIRFPYQCSKGYSAGKKTALVFVSVFTLSFVWSILGLFDWKNSFATTVTLKDNKCRNLNFLFFDISYNVYLVCLVLMGGLYVYILKVAFYHYRNIKTLSVGQQSTSRRFTDIKATRVVAIVYFAFCVCWMPLLVISNIISADPTHFPKLLKQNKTFFYFIYYTFLQILPTLNCMINPIIYGKFNTSIRTQAKKILNHAFRMNKCSNLVLMKKYSKNKKNSETTERLAHL